MRKIKHDQKKGIFRYFNGNYYLVEDVIINAESDEKMVLYRALYGDIERFVRSYESLQVK